MKSPSGILAGCTLRSSVSNWRSRPIPGVSIDVAQSFGSPRLGDHIVRPSTLGVVASSSRHPAKATIRTRGERLPVEAKKAWSLLCMPKRGKIPPKLERAKLFADSALAA